MNEFVKSGSKILVKPSGLDYSLQNNKVYNLLYDNWDEKCYLEEDGEITPPKKVYSTDTDNKFKQKILSNFKNTEKYTTGVMLAGLKGTGKTVLTKIIAKESGLPIIIVSPKFPTKQLNSFFTCINTPCCIVFDELDKNIQPDNRYGCWHSEDLLSFLDGIQNTCKKLVVFTCNDDSKASEYLKDRCSRIRYYKRYGEMDDDLIKIIVNDIIKDEKKASEVSDIIINTFKVKNFDSVISFAEECIQYPDDDIVELVKDLNITTV